MCIVNEISLENQEIIINPSSLWDFIYAFYKKFRYEISEVDAHSDNRYFKVGMIKYESSVGTFHTTIEFLGYESKLIITYRDSGNEVYTRKMKHQEDIFIKEYCKIQ